MKRLISINVLLHLTLNILNGQVDYTTQIQTIFTNNCTSCHMYGNASGGLTLTSYSSVMAGGNSGAVITPFDHANSYLWQRVNNGEMPPGTNPDLSASQIDLIALWIDEGALENPVFTDPVWYVATTGSDSIGDGTEANPFATIQTAIDSSSNGDTVLVAAGTYIENINYNGRNIAVIGEDRETTIIDGNQNGSVVTFESGEDSTTLLMNFTVTNSGGFGENDWGGGIFVSGDNNTTPILDNLIIDNNVGGGLWGYGGGGGLAVLFNGNKPHIKNSIISNTSSESESGSLFTCGDGEIKATNCLIVNNNTTGVSTGCATMGPADNKIELINCTITDNPNLAIYAYGIVLVSNSIIYENFSDDNSIAVIDGFSTVNINNTLIQGGWEGTGNIDADPFFCNPDSGDFTLAENSPCVGTGENGANMGAFGVGCGPYNFSPTEFSLSAPSNNTQITIDESNMNTGHITFLWDASSDQNGDPLYYLMRATSAEIGDHGIDTNATSFDLSYMDIIEDMSENNVTGATLEWTVHVTDGIDTVEADNAPYTMEIDGANALSAYLEEFIPMQFALHQNYPNPFNPVTTLRYDLPENGHINITVYDMLGREVKTLINQTQEAGYRSVIWDATNDYGKPVSAGIYLYQIQAGEYISTKKMVLLK